MAVSITVPMPAAPGQPLTVRIGKFGRTFDNNAEAIVWARETIRENDVLIALAILRSAERPASRGKAITIDLSLANNIVREA